MNIAIFHNFLDNIGGAEMFTLNLAKNLKADIYTTNIDAEKIKKMGFKTNNIYSIGKIPLNPPLRQQMALLKFRQLNLKNKYDFYIIAGDWAMSAAVNNQPNLWYVHSPIREIWDLYKYTRNNTVPFLLRPSFDVWVHFNRYLNRKYVKKVNKIICNSENTKRRVKKYLGREATVIYPAIDTSNIKFKKFGDFWLSVNRLISHKNVLVQLEAFTKMTDKKLVIVGSYEMSGHFKRYAQKCYKICPKNVTIKSWIDQKELADLYANCKALITTPKEEDFGINAVEAMGAGKPVLAPKEGGYKETVIDGKTGILMDRANITNIINGVKKMEIMIKKNPTKIRQACETQAKKFDSGMLINKIRNETLQG